MSNPVTDALGVPMTLAQVRDYCANPPNVEAERTIAGRTPIKRMQALADRYEEALFNQMLGRVQLLHERATARVKDSDETLDLVEQKITEWAKALRSGRLSPDEVLANVREIPPVLTAIRTDLDASRDDAEAAEEFLEQDVAEHQKAELDRLPAMRNGLPVITEAWLRGEVENDPRLPGEE